MALLVFVVWLVTPAQTNVGIGFFYAIPIGLAAWWGGRRAGAAAVVGCAVLYLIGSAIQPVPHFGPTLAVRLLAFVAVAVLVSLLRERVTVLEHSVEELEAIRAALTPSALPQLPGVDAAAAFVPSEYGVSGDFYLLTNGPDSSAVAIVGDVVGHGPEAARLATFIRARFAAFAANTSDPAELLMLANGALVDRPRDERELVSAVCLRFRAQEAQLSWAIAGHPLPLRLPGLDEFPPESPTFLLGADPNLSLSNREASLRVGEGVVVYTDGATDVRRDGAMLGLDGLSRFLAPLAKLPAAAMVTEVEKAILEWAEAPIRDDLCLLVLKPQSR
ncbi:MAG TPA: PP2C family protein-serine/threonine phosphatase [Solirubrobacterales bacterium]|jgi:serine phosphatase RsbU (regulator of sigma subunit)|nr:PP2C family protein-serine/threonine phosphatase [Solirubrobacterales bacterium]